MAFNKKYKRAFVVQFANFFLWSANKVPRSFALFLGSSFGYIAWIILRKDQHKVNRHLQLAFGDQLNCDERKKIGQSLYINCGKNLTDLVRFPNFYKSEIAPLVTVEGLHNFDNAYKEGKGVVGITGHIGNFELLAVHIASLGYDIAVIGRELYQPRLNEILVSIRESCGLTNFKTTESPRKSIRWLSDGKAIGVLIDTDSTRVRSAMLPFFGHSANTPIGQSILGLRTNSAFIPMACVRKGNNKYHIIVLERIKVEEFLDAPDAVERVTAICSKALEGIIREHKDQWIWMHNRWQTSHVKEA